MSLYNTYNNEDIISRAVIAGMLGILNNNIVYNQVWSNEEIEQIKIPWFYNQSGDERFMQDFYTHYADCNFPRQIDGNFDQIPRGILTYTGADIDSNRITNRFVQGRYLKEVDGKLQSYVSFLYSIPLTINFECEMWLDTQITALKVEQAIREAFYKTITFYVYYKGMRLGCTSGFPETIGVEKMIEYSFETGDEPRPKIKFLISVECYQPVFDPTTETDANNHMKGIGYRLSQHNETTDGEISITTPSELAVIPKGIPLIIEWNYTREGGIIKNVDAYWLLTNTNDWNLIKKGIANHEFWYWNIPDNFTSYTQPTILWDETDDVKIHRKPVLSIIPSLNSPYTIDANSFTVVNEGYFMSPTDADTSIGIVLEMKDDQGRIVYTNDNDIRINISSYKINTGNPVWIRPGANIVYPRPVDYKVIDIHIANSVNNDVFGPVKNITIL